MTKHHSRLAASESSETTFGRKIIESREGWKAHLKVSEMKLLKQE